MFKLTVVCTMISRKLFREILSALHKYVHFHIKEKGIINDINHHLDVLWNEYKYVIIVVTVF